jgi:hypothetical protein
MKKMTIAMLLSGLLMSTTASAYHCPADMKKIDAALASSPSISASQQAVDDLAKAMAILGVK